MRAAIKSSSKAPSLIKLSVSTDGKRKLCVEVYSHNAPNTIYSRDYYMLPAGTHNLSVPLPLVPEKGYIEVYAIDSVNNKIDRGFRIENMTREPLKTNLNVFESKKQTILDFIDFMQSFAERASYISAGPANGDYSIYKSPDGKFIIQYVDVILDDEGKPKKTSMRVNNRTGVMQIAKKYMQLYTIPERVAIMLHEFAHFYLNKNHKDEFEADLNALLIYCALGYPRKQALTAWHKVFYRTPSDLNVKRMEQISRFLENFDKSKHKFVNNRVVNAA